MTFTDPFDIPKKKHRQQLSFLISTFYDYQECRKAFDNRVRQFFSSEGKYDQRVEEVKDKADDLEGEVEGLIKPVVKEEPIFNDFLSRIKGIGPVMAGNLIGRVCVWREYTRTKEKGIEPKSYERVIDETSEEWVVESPPILANADYVTQIWSYCGLDGDAQRKRGKQLNYDPKLRELFSFKLPAQFAKGGSEYKRIHDENKERLMRRDDIEKSGHAEGIARELTGKIFLSHFWYMWRKEQGLKCPPLYHIKNLDTHNSVYQPFVEQPEFEQLEFDFDG